MKRPWRWWAAWIVALSALILLAVSSVLLYLYAPWKGNLEVETGAFWLDALFLMGAPVLGLIIALRQPQNRYGWLWLVFGLASAVIAIGAAIYYMHGARQTGYTPLIALLLWAYVPATIISVFSLALFALWFPTGQPPTPRWRFLEWWLAIDLLLFIPGLFIEGVLPNSTVAIDNPLGFLPEEIASIAVAIGWFNLVLAALLSAISIFFRYRGAGRVEKQQIKWFLLGGAGLVSEFVVILIPIGNILLTKIYNDVMLLLVFGTIGIAILRHRLYEIDLIIRRTLLYALLSAILGLVYFGGVVVMEQVFRSLTGQPGQSPAAIVLSTLAIAALFSPLRRRIQDFIDRRFYRRRYDAEQTLQAFAGTLREELNLDQLSESLIAVVQDTMQPESVSLWLRSTKKAGRM